MSDNFFYGMVLSVFMAISLISCHKDKTNNNDSTENPGGGEIPSTVVLDAVTDIDGNAYDAVWIGDQLWMKENLRTTHYADNTAIPLGTEYSTTTSYRYYPNNDANNVSAYGYLYNWPAIMHGESGSENNPSGVQGICPTGWHVPSNAEWSQLFDYLSSHSQYVCGPDSSYIAKALAATTGWNVSEEPYAIGCNPNMNNASGFSALPAGDFRDGYYNFFGDFASFWSTTDINDYDYGQAFSCVYYRFLYLNSGCVDGGCYNKDYAFSVRCLRD